MDTNILHGKTLEQIGVKNHRQVQEDFTIVKQGLQHLLSNYNKITIIISIVIEETTLSQNKEKCYLQRRNKFSSLSSNSQDNSHKYIYSLSDECSRIPHLFYDILNTTEASHLQATPLKNLWQPRLHVHLKIEWTRDQCSINILN